MVNQYVTTFAEKIRFTRQKIPHIFTFEARNTIYHFDQTHASQLHFQRRKIKSACGIPIDIADRCSLDRQRERPRERERNALMLNGEMPSTLIDAVALTTYCRLTYIPGWFSFKSYGNFFYSFFFSPFRLFLIQFNYIDCI